MSDNKELEILNKVNGIDKNTQSQQDRIFLQEDMQKNIMSFITLQMNRVNNKDELKDKINQELLSRLNDEEEPLSDGALIKLLEIINKRDVDISVGIMGLLKENLKVQINNEQKGQEEQKKNIFSAEQVKEAKEALDAFRLIKQLEDSELSEEEKLNLIQKKTKGENAI